MYLKNNTVTVVSDQVSFLTLPGGTTVAAKEVTKGGYALIDSDQIVDYIKPSAKVIRSRRKKTKLARKARRTNSK